MYRAVIFFSIILLGTLVCGRVHAHQWTPTYPTVEQSYVPGVLRIRMEILNTRPNIKHYQISVFDEEWKPISFAVSDRIMRVQHLQRKTVDIHIRDEDRDVVKYVCSKSKIITNDERVTFVTSRICSKVK
jgi:hypothetical protein